MDGLNVAQALRVLTGRGKAAAIHDVAECGPTIGSPRWPYPQWPIAPQPDSRKAP